MCQSTGWCLSSVHRQSCYCSYVAETGRRHPCHGADADSFGPLAIVIPQLQYIDQVFDVLVEQFQQIRSKSWETVEIPQLQLVVSGPVIACPLCATTGAVWFGVQKTALVPQLQCSDMVSGIF